MSRTYHHGERNRRKHGYGEWGWVWREPKWWRKMAKHQKRRSQTRMSLNRVMRGDEDTLFPLDKKPWIYYW